MSQPTPNITRSLRNAFKKNLNRKELQPTKLNLRNLINRKNITPWKWTTLNNPATIAEASKTNTKTKPFVLSFPTIKVSSTTTDKILHVQTSIIEYYLTTQIEL